MEAHIPVGPLLFVCGRPELMHLLDVYRLILTIIPVNHVDMVIQFVDVPLPGEVIPIRLRKYPLVLDDPFSDRSSAPEP